ncbi:hypothetical protein MTO96_046620 [Rhipicephalus appendiculatus]
MRIRQPRPARRVADWSPRRAFGALGVYSSTGGGPNRAADEHLAHSAFARSPTVARTVEPTKCRRSRQRTSGRPFSGTWQPVKSAADHIPAISQSSAVGQGCLGEALRR